VSRHEATPEEETGRDTDHEPSPDPERRADRADDSQHTGSERTVADDIMGRTRHRS
jgi:hypothetical protein